MLNIALNGYLGSMCQTIANLATQNPSIKIIAGIDSNFNKNSTAYNVATYNNIEELDIKPDVIIDFSHYSCVEKLVTYSSKNNIPLVIATTGLDKNTNILIKESSKQIPIFISSNMSVGINILTKLVCQAAKVLENSFDIEIIERHHNKKIDAPSGTAYMIANSINNTLNNSKKFIYKRHDSKIKRSVDEIGIHSIRGGTITGEHNIIFAGNDEIIEIKHTALSKKIFAVGAVRAAEFIYTQKPGLYDMNDMLEF